MSTTVFLIIFVILGSTIFPLVGYYIDWQKHKKLHLKDRKSLQKAAAQKQ